MTFYITILEKLCDALKFSEKLGISASIIDIIIQVCILATSMHHYRSENVLTV